MPSAKGIRVTLLIEDRRFERFARCVLTNLGFGRHEVRVQRAPEARNAKQWVVAEYPNHVRVYRSKAGHQRIGLLVGTDADELTVVQQGRALAECLAEKGMAARAEGERIVLWIAKWHVETWILALTGYDVDEEDRYKRDPRELDIPAAAARFVEEYRRPQEERAAKTLPSLSVAYDETKRLD